MAGSLRLSFILIAAGLLHEAVASVMPLRSTGAVDLDVGRKLLQECRDLTTVNGQAVCPSCCATWKRQGKCDGSGSTVLGGQNVRTTVCRATCGTCTSSGGSSGGCPTGWSMAVGTLYDSWPKPGTKECTEYSGCRWAGMFSNINGGSKPNCVNGARLLNGGNGVVDCRFPEATVKSWNMAATNNDDKALLNRKLQVMVQGVPAKVVTVNVLDVCKDSDCSGCCSKNTANRKYKLIDIEKWPASALLGFSTSDPNFDVNNVKTPPAGALRPELPYTMALCYKDVGAAINPFSG